MLFYSFIEYLWTFIPFILILLMILPFFIFTNSQFSLFTHLDQILLVFPTYVTANQWFWDFFVFDYAFQFTGLVSFTNYLTYMTLTSADVIHAFYLPYFFLKSDCVPGLLANLYFTPSACGIYHGYCAQICGQQHALMGFTLSVFPNQSLVDALTTPLYVRCKECIVDCACTHLLLHARSI